MNDWDTLFSDPLSVEAAQFVVDSEEKADWVLRQLATLSSEKERITAQYKERCKQIEADEAALHYRFDAELEHFARERLAGGKRKSLTLLQGTLGFRKVPAAIRLSDPEGALAYAMASGMYRALKTVLDTTVYREIAKSRAANGAIIPGMEIVEEHESFSVRFGKEKE